MPDRTATYKNSVAGLHSSIANRSDEKILQRFCRDNPTEGSVRFCLLREPGFFDALEVEGSINDVGMIKDDNKLVGIGIRSEKDVYINGKKEKLGYYSGIRILKGYRGSRVFFRIARMAREKHKQSECKIYLGNIFSDNVKALDILISPHRTNPSVRFIGKYHTFIFRPERQKPNTAGNDTKLRIWRANQDDIEDLIAFLNKQGESRQYFPVYTVDHLEKEKGLLKDLSIDRILIARHNNSIVGTMALWDQNNFRYWMIKGYSGMLSFIRLPVNLIATMQKKPGFPPRGTILNYKIISLCCIDPDYPNAFVPLLNQTLLDLGNERSVYAVIGFHESDPLLNLFKLPAVRLVSRLYKIYWPENALFAEQIDNRPPYFELGSL
jgi:hypothetical protein